MVQTFIEKIDNPAVMSKIVKSWVNDELVSSLFEKHQIEKNFFITHFGLKILDYFVLVFSGKVEIGNCPYIEKFLEYLHEKDITVGEVFLICSGLKKSILQFILDEDFTKEEKKKLFNQLYNTFDKNLSSVLDRFI